MRTLSLGSRRCLASLAVDRGRAEHSGDYSSARRQTFTAAAPVLPSAAGRSGPPTCPSMRQHCGPRHADATRRRHHPGGTGMAEGAEAPSAGPATNERAEPAALLAPRAIPRHPLDAPFDHRRAWSPQSRAGCPRHHSRSSVTRPTKPARRRRWPVAFSCCSMAARHDAFHQRHRAAGARHRPPVWRRSTRRRRFRAIALRGAGRRTDDEWRAYGGSQKTSASERSAASATTRNACRVCDRSRHRPHSGIAPVPRQDWLDFAQVVRQAGCPLVFLVPYRQSRWPPALRRALAIVHWDPSTTAGSSPVSCEPPLAPPEFAGDAGRSRCCR